MGVVAAVIAFALLAIVVAYLLYRWSVATYDYFELRRVPYVKPWPFFGGLWPFFAGRMTAIDAGSAGYRQFPDSKFSGFFTFRTPGYLIHDPALVKLITIKDFDHFVDHSFGISEEVDPFLGRDLFFSKGQRWRQGRAALSPAFTGSKMRNMFGLLSGYSNGAMKRLVESAGGVKLELEARELFQKLGNDIMTSISFGVDIDSVRNPDNEFLEKGKAVAATGSIEGWKIFFATMIPSRILKFLGIKITPPSVVDFYGGLVSRTIKYREENNISRPDFIHLLVQARKNELKRDKADESLASAGFSTVQEHLTPTEETTIRWTDQEITSATASFIFGGIESTTIALCFALYELCRNPELQDKLRCEIDAVREDLGDRDLSYEVIHSMRYLDMVLTETLRLWTPFGVTNRRCTKEYIMQNNDGTEVVIEKDQLIEIPLHAIHRDPRYFPDPLRFDPERFSDENRHKINQDAYLPFGSGPRNCIASRLALMQAKCLLYFMLSNFVVELSERMDVPIQLDKRAVGIKAKNGFWFNFMPREKINP